MTFICSSAIAFIFPNSNLVERQLSLDRCLKVCFLLRDVLRLINCEREEPEYIYSHSSKPCFRQMFPTLAKIPTNSKRSWPIPGNWKMGNRKSAMINKEKPSKKCVRLFLNTPFKWLRQKTLLAKSWYEFHFGKWEAGQNLGLVPLLHPLSTEGQHRHIHKWSKLSTR